MFKRATVKLHIQAHFHRDVFVRKSGQPSRHPVVNRARVWHSLATRQLRGEGAHLQPQCSHSNAYMTSSRKWGIFVSNIVVSPCPVHGHNLRADSDKRHVSMVYNSSLRDPALHSLGSPCTDSAAPRAIHLPEALTPLPGVRRLALPCSLCTSST